MRKLVYAAALAALALGISPANAEPAKTGKTSAGDALVTMDGKALYTFEKDKDGKSACNGGCAANWPPLMATGSDKAAGDWTVITRDDGSHQWAYKGAPLYTWVKDAKPGDAGGGKVPGWHLATP